MHGNYTPETIDKLKRCPEAVPSISINVSIVNKYLLNCLLLLFLINIPAEAKICRFYANTNTDPIEGAFAGLNLKFLPPPDMLYL